MAKSAKPRTSTPSKTLPLKRVAVKKGAVKKALAKRTLIKKKADKKNKKKVKKLSPEEKAQLKEQLTQKKDVQKLMENIGFLRMPFVDGKEFTYANRTSEIDDIFYFENIIVVTEYTIGKAGAHLVNKKIIYDKINENPSKFLKFLMEQSKFKPLKDAMDKKVFSTYTLNQLQIRILYVTKQNLSDEHKVLVSDVHYFEYSIFKYFESISRVIKKSTKYEFFDFLNIEFGKIGTNMLQTSISSTDEFSGHILPEEHSTFKEGYKIVSFYIDAESLLKRAYVLRRDGWKNSDNIGLYQRMLVANKIKSMRKYLHEEKRVFINNIIVTLPVDKIKMYDSEKNELHLDKSGNFKKSITNVLPTLIKIESKSNIIGIIDGQHRSYAYHEGDDMYESSIAKLRGIQNLLITGILYPQEEMEEKRIKFEAKLFLEINTTQAGASTQLKQEIEYIMNPFSTVSISKHILKKLNESGPMNNLFEEYWYERSKIKTSSIISFGLKPLVKFDGVDSLFNVWSKASKEKLKKKDDEYDLLNEYKAYCTEQVRNVFIGVSANIDRSNWTLDRSDPNAILNVTTVNGIINCLRKLIENGKTGDINYYKEKFMNIKSFKFKDYKSSQYRKMGTDIYNLCF
jgi:DGQHR domain-containing protein